MQDFLEVKAGTCTFRPCGESTLVEAVGLITDAIAYCRAHQVDRLLVVTNGLVGISMPTLVDRFLMVEEWASAAGDMLVGALVVSPQYIHPEKFGVQVASEFGLVLDVFSSESDALHWLSAYCPPGGHPRIEA